MVLSKWPEGKFAKNFWLKNLEHSLGCLKDERTEKQEEENTERWAATNKQEGEGRREEGRGRQPANSTYCPS